MPVGPGVSVSWLAVLIGVVLLAIAVKGLAHPGTRPYLAGLGLAAGLAVAWFVAMPVAPRMEFKPSPRTPAANPTAADRPKEKAGDRPSADAKGAAEGTETPAWVAADPWMRNSGLGLIDDVYFLRVEVGPAGLQDCKRELPQAIRAALVQHAEDLGLDRDVTARIQVPDELLLKSVRDQWPQQSLIRRVSQPAGHDDNAIQYVLVGLDAATRQRIRMDVEQTVVRERLAAGAVIVAGVLGLLGLAWVGLKLAAGKAQ